jgi:protein TonB
MMVCALSGIAAGQAVGPITAARKIKDVPPVYPPESLRAGDEGAVLFELRITPSGIVGEARILWSSCKRLERAALTAVRQWRYTPMLVNGEPAPFTVSTSVPFRLPARLKDRAGRAGACTWKEPPKPITE